MEEINITANSNAYQIQPPMSVAQFIQAFGFRPEKCVVNLNGRLMHYEAYCSLLLKNGDVLNIMALYTDDILNG